MKLNKRLNTLTYLEYGNLLSQYRKYTDFNTLGLFRSIIENEKLTSDQKTSLRDEAIALFGKTFNFLQLKDPTTYFQLTTLGQDLTVADEAQRWTLIRRNQQLLLKDKKLGHRNFGTYSRHDCGYDTCSLNGLMIRQNASGVPMYGTSLSFCTDKDRYVTRTKATMRKQERKRDKAFIERRLAEE